MNGFIAALNRLSGVLSLTMTGETDFISKAEAGLRQQLRPGAADFEQALGIAAVMAALGQLRALDGEPERFTAGDFSVTMGRQNSLCAQAQALLRPWMAEGFAFRRV